MRSKWQGSSLECYQLSKFRKRDLNMFLGITSGFHSEGLVGKLNVWIFCMEGLRDLDVLMERRKPKKNYYGG